MKNNPKPLWAFDALPATNELVGVRIGNMDVRNTVRALLPNSTCLLAVNTDTFVEGRVAQTPLDIASCTFAHAVCTLAAKQGATYIHNGGQGTEPITSGLFAKITTVRQYIDFASRVFAHYTQMPVTAGIPVASVLNAYRHPLGAHVQLSARVDEHDVEFPPLGPERVQWFSRACSPSLAIPVALDALRLIRRCIAVEHRIDPALCGEARDLSIEASVRRMFGKDRVSVTPAASQRYLSRSLFAVKLATAASHLAFTIATMYTRTGNDVGATEARVHALCNEHDTLLRCAIPLGKSRVPTHYEGYRALLTACVYPFGISEDCVDAIMAALAEINVPPTAAILMTYAASLAATAFTDMQALTTFYDSGQFLHIVDLCLLIENGGTLEQLRAHALAVTEALIAAQGHDTDVIKFARGDDADDGDDDAASPADLPLVIRDTVLGLDTLEDMRPACAAIVNGFRAVLSMAGERAAVVSIPAIMQGLRMRSQFLFSQFFGHGNVIDLPRYVCEANALAPVYVILRNRTPNVADVSDAVHALGAAGMALPEFQDVLAEADTWRRFMFPEAALDGTSDWFGFL